MNSSSETVPAEQLLLHLRPRPAINFDSFVIAASNETTLHALREWLRQPSAGVFFIVGAPGSGRSHLLQAACTEVDGAMYLPLAELKTLDPASLLDGLEAAPLLCLDDIDAVVGERSWCEVLFHCFNRQVGPLSEGGSEHMSGGPMSDGPLIDSTVLDAPTGGKWLVSAQVPAAQLPCALADLGSRLSWGGSFRLAPLDDTDRQRMLQLHARQRGMEISDELAVYILQRASRETPALLALLERMDRESLRSQQRIGIPLVRRLLNDTV